MTYKEALNKLYFPYNIMAIYEMKRQNPERLTENCYDYNLFMVIASAFSWKESKMGRNFWRRVSMKISKK